MSKCALSRIIERLPEGGVTDEEFDALQAHLPTCCECTRAMEALAPKDVTSWFDEDYAVETPADRAVWESVSAKPEPVPEIAGYKRLHIIGSGGMGIVYRAWEQGGDREVAVKVLKRDLLRDMEHRDRFGREARAAGRIQHDNVVQFYHIDAAADPPYIVMEFVRGESLSKRIQSGVALHPAEAGEIARQVALALDAAHRAKVTHRDVKPAHILMTDGIGAKNRERQAGVQVKLADFGLASAIERSDATASESNQSGSTAAPGNRLVDSPTRLTVTGQILGTPKYMSPEQALGSSTDTRTDIYSLGAVLYEMLTGLPPYQGIRDAVILRQIADKDPVPAPTRRNPDIPRDLETITLKCLEKEPKRRYQTARDVADDLGLFLRGEPIKARPPALIELLWRWARRNPRVAMLYAIIAATLLTLAIGGIGTAVAISNRERTTRRHLYAADLNRSGRSLDAGRLNEVREVLESTRPRYAGGDDFRRWEWFYLYHLTHTEEVRFDGHTGNIRVAAFSPDGQRAVSADDSGEVIIWKPDSKDGKGIELLRLQPFHAAVSELAFSPDGRYLAAASRDSTAAILSVHTGDVLQRLDRHLLAVNALAYSPDGKLLATGGADNVIKLWDTATGRDVAALVGHTHEVRRLWFHQSGKRLASVGDDQTLRFWDLPEGKEDTEAAVKPVPTVLAMSRDFARAAVWRSREAKVTVLNMPSRDVAAEFPGYQRPVRQMSFNGDGTLLATADEDGDAVVLDFAQDRMLSHNRGLATTVAFSAQGDRIVSVCSDNRVRIWPAKSPEHDWFRGHDGGVKRVAFHPKGQLIATGDAAGSIRLWDAANGQPLRTLGIHIGEKGPPGTPQSERLKAMQESKKPLRNVQHFVPGSGSEYAPNTLREVYVFEGHSGEILSLVFSADGAKLVSAARDADVRVWDVASGTELRAFKHPQPASSVAFSPNGKLIVTGCWDDAVRIWNAEDGKELLTLREHTDNVDAVVFHPDGKHVASAGVDRIIRIWDITTGRETRTLDGHTAAINCLALSTDGRLLASGDGDAAIRVWEFETGKPWFVLRGHTERVTALAFHPTDKDRLVSASNHRGDGTARVWDLSIGRELLAMAAPVDRIHGLAFDPMGKRLAITVVRQIVMWDAVDRGEEKADPVRPLAEPPARPDQLTDAEVTAKVLGYQRFKELARIHDKKSRLRPTDGANDFLVVVVSVPHGTLYPTDAEHEKLRQKAVEDPDENPVGPARSYALYDAGRFLLIMPDGTSIPGFAAGPVPWTYGGDEGGGFNTEITVEVSTSTLDPHSRALLAVAWELPSDDLPEPLQLEWQATSAIKRVIAVPKLRLDGYRGDHSPEGGPGVRANRASSSDPLLVQQRIYSVLERNK